MSAAEGSRVRCFGIGHSRVAPPLARLAHCARRASSSDLTEGFDRHPSAKARAADSGPRFGSLLPVGLGYRWSGFPTWGRRPQLFVRTFHSALGACAAAFSCPPR